MGNNIKKITEEQKKEILRLYIEEGRGQLYISKKVLGVGSPDRIKRVLKEAGVPIRNYSQAATLSNKNRETFKNKKFFSTETQDMAWLMGFIAADGYIRKDANEIGIGLARQDREILEKIKEILELETSVKDYTTQDGYDCSKLTWTCEQHKKDLAKYNIVPAKTFTLKPPYNLNRKYWIDFIRGYFDGDGSINKIQQGSLRWQACSASKEIIEWIINFLYEEYNIPKVSIYTVNNKNPLYYCQYSTNATKQIFKVLYTENGLYLKRKYEHFKKILNE